MHDTDKCAEAEPKSRNTEQRLSELSGLLWRVMESFEVIRFGVFASLGANLVLIAVLLLR